MILAILGIILAGAILVFGVGRYIPPSKCNGDCNQGRNCTCEDK